MKRLSYWIGLVLLLSTVGCGNADAPSEASSSSGSSVSIDEQSSQEAVESSSVSSHGQSEESVSSESAPATESPSSSPSSSPSQVEGFDPGDQGGGESQAAEMVDLTIQIVDKNGAPVPNLCVNLELVSGADGNYMPGDALTGSDGTVIRGANPGSTYNVIVSDRKQLDYEGVSLRGQKIFSVTARANDSNHHVLAWDLPTPAELDQQASGKVTLTFLNASGKPMPDLWVSGSPADDTSPEPRQIVFGITDQQGKVYWTSPELGAFVGAAHSDVDGGNHQYDSFSFTVTDRNQSFQFTWVAETA